MKIVAGIEDFCARQKNVAFRMPTAVWSEIHRAKARKSIPGVRKLAADHRRSKVIASGGLGCVVK